MNKLLIASLLSFVTARIVVDQHVAYSKHIEDLIQYHFKNRHFTLIDEVNFEHLNVYPWSGGKITYSFLPSYVNDKQVILILNTSQTADYKLALDQIGYDKTVFILEATKLTDLDHPIELLLEAWQAKRTRIGLVRFEAQGISLVTNLNLEPAKICTSHFYEEHSNYGSENSTITRQYFSKTDLRRLCRVKVSWVRGHPFVNDIKRKTNPGLMVSFLRTYREKRAVRVIFQKDNDGYQNEFLYNGTFLQLRKDLARGKYDVAVGHLFMNSTRVTPFYYGPIFFHDAIYMVARKKRAFTNYEKLLVIFTRDLWTHYFSTFFLAVFLYFLISRVIDSKKLSILSAFLDVFKLSLGTGVSILPTSTSLRLLFVFYSLYSVIIDTVYLGKLSSVFTNTSYAIKLEEFHLLLFAGVKFQASWYMERLCKLQMVSSRNFSNSTRKGNALVNLTEAELLKHVADTQENGTIVFWSTLVTHPSEAQLIDYSFVKSAYLTLFATFYIRNDSHLKDSLQFWGNEMLEKGFLLKWTRDLIQENTNNSLLPPPEKKEAVALKLANFQEMFKLLALGFGIAAVTLVLEFFYKWLDDNYLVTDKIIFLIGLLKPPPTIA